MQPANGIHLIRVEISPSSPIAGAEVCVVLSTPIPPGALTVRITVGSSIVHDGPPPPNNEICFDTSPEDQGKAVQASVSATTASGIAAYGTAAALLE